MLFKQAVLKKIAAGKITIAFRRWKRPTVKAGGTLRTSIGVLGIRKVEKVDRRRVTPAAAKQAGFDSVEELFDSLGDRPGSLYRIALRRIGDDPRIALRKDDRLDEEDIRSLRTRLDRLDARSARGPWTLQVLRLIERNPARRAVDLAAQMGIEQHRLKTDIRKLKNLGLTESLEVGYRLSPRGKAWLAIARSKS
jgi:DNA-binding HxlR family transcriptional regulator